MATIGPVARLVITDAMRTIVTGVLADARCTCGSPARRLVIERDPLSRWPVGHRRPLKDGPLIVRSWCGDTTAHERSWSGLMDVLPGTDDDTALYEEDL